MVVSSWLEHRDGNIRRGEMRCKLGKVGDGLALDQILTIIRIKYWCRVSLRSHMMHFRSTGCEVIQRVANPKGLKGRG